MRLLIYGVGAILLVGIFILFQPVKVMAQACMSLDALAQGSEVFAEVAYPGKNSTGAVFFVFQDAMFVTSVLDECVVGEPVAMDYLVAPVIIDDGTRQPKRDGRAWP